MYTVYVYIYVYMYTHICTCTCTSAIDLKIYQRERIRTNTHMVTKTRMHTSTYAHTHAQKFLRGFACVCAPSWAGCVCLCASLGAIQQGAPERESFQGIGSFNVFRVGSRGLPQSCYGVASISRLLKIIGLFCKRAL